MEKKNNFFLFSIDLEDVRMRMSDGQKYRERVPQMIEKYLTFLQKYNFKITFFTLGDLAEKYPSLIKTIVTEGHEIACHSYKHTTLNNQTKVEFRDDLKKNIEVLYSAGAKKIYGFRAPVFSLTEKTKWAYEVLAELGFKYSSSVLPAKNPLFGWENFGEKIKNINGIAEIPMSVSSYLGKKIPFGGGIYFRLLPYYLIKYSFRKSFKKNLPVLGYFHPYDIDTEQEYFMFPELNENKIFNRLMYYNRSSVFEKLEKLISMNFIIIPYCDYLKQVSAQ